MKKILLLAATIFCFLNLVNAQTGDLDPSFGTNGIVRTYLGESFTYPYGAPPASQILSQPDGSMYVVQKYKQYLSKRHSNGSIDSGFGLDGYSAYAGFNINMAAIQPDGKIVAIGTIEYSYLQSDFALARFNTDGSLDSSFSIDGKQTTDVVPLGGTDNSADKASSVAIQKDGKIVVGGLSNNYVSLTRYNTNGSPDSTFDGDGLLISDFYDWYDKSPAPIAIQSDGKIIAQSSKWGMYLNLAIVRYNTDGSRDSTFKEDEFQAFRSIDYAVIQGNGKIVVAGDLSDYGAVLARFNADGSLDKSFSNDGKQETGFGVNSLALQNDGKIVAVGNSNFARYNTDGSLDNSFSRKSYLPDVETNSVAIQSDGKIVTAGGDPTENSYFAVTRYNKNGTLDNTFGNNGRLKEILHAGNTTFNKTAIQKDGKIVAAGSTWNGSDFDFAIARYNIDGSPDNTFNGNGAQTTDFGSTDYRGNPIADRANSLAIQSDGKIVAAGGYDLARYNTDGSLDKTFSGVGKQTTDTTIYIKSAAIQKDGKIVVVGAAPGYDPDDFYYYGSTFSIARYNIDGSLDQTFAQGGKQTVDIFTDSYASSVAIQNDGKIVVIGLVTNFYDGYTYHQIPVVRLNTDGSLDNTFADNGKTYSNSDGYYGSYGEDIYPQVIIQNDGKILTASPTYNGSDRGTILGRFNTDGSIDGSFKGRRGLYGNHLEFTSMALQSDGKIVLSATDLVRYNTDGSLDPAFNIHAREKVPFNIHDIAIVNNKLYAVGGQYYGAVAKYLLDSNSNKPPTVTLSTPFVKYSAPANIKLNTKATDTDGTITKVEFYNGTTLLHTETVIPYGYWFTRVPVGNYTLTAKAYDNSGNVTTSDAIKVSVVNENVPPVVSIVKPADNQTYGAHASVRLVAKAKDPNDTISKVEFYSNNTLIRTEYYYPYTYWWDNVQAGTYSIIAVATDAQGLSATSEAIHITVEPNEAPIVNITTPANNQTFTGPATLNLEAIAKDADGTIHKVEFYNGTTLLAIEKLSPYTYTWKDVSVGNYTITAKAFDNEAAPATSVINITVTAKGAIVSSRPSSADTKIEVNNAISLKLYPNPAKNILSISTTGLQQDKPSAILVISASGVVVKTIQSNASSKVVQLDISSLVSGVYTVKITSGDKILYKQFVKL